MPLYEYICDQDGTALEVQRPMADADKPLPDPDGRRRTFTRQISTFMTADSAAADVPLPACCPCGKPGGGCGGN